MTDQQSPDSTMERARISQIIREEIARRRMSRQGLADQARISLSTLEKALSGQRSFTLSTVIRLEDVLGVRLRAPSPVAPKAASIAQQTAPAHLGAYSRASVEWLEGRYWTVRPGFHQPDTVFAYLTTIAWSDEDGHLTFCESERVDAHFAQKGSVSLPYLSSHIHLLTEDHGQYRSITLGRPTIRKALHGILSTLFAGEGTQLVPMACPIVLKALTSEVQPALGSLNTEHPEFARARQMLDETIKAGFAQFRC